MDLIKRDIYLIVFVSILSCLFNALQIDSQLSPVVAAPKTKFQCGRRGRIPIIFGSPSRIYQPRLTPPFRREPLYRISRSLKPGLALHVGPKPDIDISVVGGSQSFQNSWPWMALLGRKRRQRNDFFCSGVLINELYVLTAAHCVLSLETFFVRLGEHNFRKLDIKNPPQDFVVDDVIFHPKYNLKLAYNDIALLKLSKPVTFTDKIRPVCLPWGRKANENLLNKKVTLTGWGNVAFGGQQSRFLQEVQVTVFDSTKCAKSYSTLPEYSRAFPDAITNKNFICAGDVKGGKDACQGDSGGPLVKENGFGTYTMFGVISRGYGCGHKDFPGLYAPLGNQESLQWIKKVAF